MFFERSAFIVLFTASLVSAADLVTLEGKKATGTVASIDGSRVILQVDKESKPFSMTSLDSITITAMNRIPAFKDKTVQVELIDGTILLGTDYRVKGKTAILTLLPTRPQDIGKIEIPVNTILYMVRDISNPKINQEFRNILAKRNKFDIWVIERKDSLDGIAGTFAEGDEKAEATSFQLETGVTTPIQFNSLYGAIYSQAPDVKLGQTTCRVFDMRKNNLNAQSIVMLDNKHVVVMTTTGLRFEYNSLDSIAMLDFSAGSLRFLANMEPTKVERSTSDGLTPLPYLRNRNIEGSELSIDKKSFLSGLYLPTRTVLTYELNAQFKLFQAVAGIDDDVYQDNEVTLTIESDTSAKPLLKQVFKKGEKAKLLNLNVSNVKELKITVESNFFATEGQIDLADAKLLK